MSSTKQTSNRPENQAATIVTHTPMAGNYVDIAQYAELFLQNHINGRRLLHLTQNDLRSMGISSVGHRLDLNVSLFMVKQFSASLS